MSGIETERKFLVRGCSYRAGAVLHSHIIQGYICSGQGHTVRVRLRDGRGFLTIKGPSADGGVSRYEFEHEITPDEAEHLMRLCEPGLIDKTRYMVPAGKHVIEVDEFHGDNAGLVLAEVELSNAGEPFEKPSFIGPEVTGDHRFYNSSLRSLPYTLWRGTIPTDCRHTELE